MSINRLRFFFANFLIHHQKKYNSQNFRLQIAYFFSGFVRIFCNTASFDYGIVFSILREAIPAMFFAMVVT